MISTEDERWLSDNYPGLVPSGSGVAGTVAFSATYNHELDRFLILVDGIVDDIGGIRLSCQYRVRIDERHTKGYSALPALHVEGLELIDDRHFTRYDQSACLCSPIEERVFLEPSFDFKRFLEQLVIPFLYGQSFYSEFHHWPWMEYTHAAVGLLESFVDAPLTDPGELLHFLQTIAFDRSGWPGIRAALQREDVKGHTPCFCLKHDHIRRCHPKALAGLRQLQQRIREQSVPLPE